MTKGHSSHLVPLLACLGILAGCGEGGRTPTSPEPMASTSAAQVAAQAAARLNTGRPQAGLPEAVAEASRGGGLPRKHRDGSTPQRRGSAPPRDGSSGGGAPGEVQLSLEIQPDTWNVDFSHTPGTVSALIGGTGLDAVDRGSIVLAGPAGTARPLSVRRAGDRLEAIFTDADAIGTLASPIPGERQRVTVRLTAGGGAQALDGFVLIVGQTVY